jgi:hypothetical protein
MYGEITGQLQFTPYQEKILKGFGAGPMVNASDEAKARRAKVIKRGGPLRAVIRNPKDVHTLYGDYGPEAVVYATIWKTPKLLSTFGNLAKDLRAQVKAETAHDQYALFDVTDYGRHVIFAVPTESDFELPDISSGILPKGGLLFMNQGYDLPFLNWICRVSGSMLDTDAEDQRIPMLYTVDKADQFNIQNIVQTLVLSEAIRVAAAPRGLRTGPGADKMEVDYGDPAADIVAKTGQSYQRLSPPEIDKALFELSTWITANVEKSTVPRVLQGGNVPSSTFSTLNLTVQSGMQVVEPYKQMAERWLEDAARMALLWVDYHGEPVTAYERKSETSEMGKTGRNLVSYELDPKKFDADRVIISVELEPDLPIDRTSRINGARMLMEMGLPARVAYEELGEKDATGVQREARFEQLERFFFDRFMKLITQKDEMNMQMAMSQAQMQMEMAAQQEQMAMQQQAQPQTPPPQEVAGPPGEPPPWAAGGVGPGGQEPVPGTPPGIEGIEGEGFNPAVGGQPPAQADPGATFEGQTGRSRGGQEIV